MECANPPLTPLGPVYPRFGLFDEDELPITVTLHDFSWLLGRTLSRNDKRHLAETQRNVMDTQESESPPTNSTNITSYSCTSSRMVDLAHCSYASTGYQDKSNGSYKEDDHLSRLGALPTSKETANDSSGFK